jgi:hypothetical protein
MKKSVKTMSNKSLKMCKRRASSMPEYAEKEMIECKK